MMRTEATINGYVTNLGKYNEGELIGQWVSFPITDEDFANILEAIGINGEYEEYFFTDWESEFVDPSELGEFPDLEDINELAEALEGADADLISAIMEAGYITDIKEVVDRADEWTLYAGATLLDVAYELVEECYELPEFAKRYFDYEAFARDLSFDGYTETSYGVIC